MPSQTQSLVPQRNGNFYTRCACRLRLKRYAIFLGDFFTRYGFLFVTVVIFGDFLLRYAVEGVLGVSNVSSIVALLEKNSLHYIQIRILLAQLAPFIQVYRPPIHGSVKHKKTNTESIFSSLVVQPSPHGLIGRSNYRIHFFGAIAGALGAAAILLLPPSLVFFLLLIALLALVQVAYTSDAASEHTVAIALFSFFFLASVSFCWVLLHPTIFQWIVHGVTYTILLLLGRINTLLPSYQPSLPMMIPAMGNMVDQVDATVVGTVVSCTVLSSLFLPVLAEQWIKSTDSMKVRARGVSDNTAEIEKLPQKQSAAPVSPASHRVWWYASFCSIHVIISVIVTNRYPHYSPVLSVVGVIGYTVLNFYAMPLHLAKFAFFCFLSEAVDLSMSGMYEIVYTATEKEFPGGPHFSHFFYSSVNSVLWSLGGIVGVLIFPRLFGKRGNLFTILCTFPLIMLAQLACHFIFLFDSPPEKLYPLMKTVDFSPWISSWITIYHIHYALTTMLLGVAQLLQWAACGRLSQECFSSNHIPQFGPISTLYTYFGMSFSKDLTQCIRLLPWFHVQLVPNRKFNLSNMSRWLICSSVLFPVTFLVPLAYWIIPCEIQKEGREGHEALQGVIRSSSQRKKRERTESKMQKLGLSRAEKRAKETLKKKN